MYKLVILAAVCILPLISADCGPLEILKVKRQWGEAYGNGNERVEFAQHLWKKVFVKEPKIKEFLKSVGSENIYSALFKAHASRSVGNLDVLIGLLDDPDTFQAQVAFFKAAQKKKGVPLEYFKALGDALLEVVPHRIGGRSFDQVSWTECRDVISKELSKGESAPASA